jgi:hypothetical protein
MDHLIDRIAVGLVKRSDDLSAAYAPTRRRFLVRTLKALGVVAGAGAASVIASEDASATDPCSLCKYQDCPYSTGDRFYTCNSRGTFYCCWCAGSNALPCSRACVKVNNNACAAASL